MVRPLNIYSVELQFLVFELNPISKPSLFQVTSARTLHLASSLPCPMLARLLRCFRKILTKWEKTKTDLRSFLQGLLHGCSWFSDQPNVSWIFWSRDFPDQQQHAPCEGSGGFLGSLVPEFSAAPAAGKYNSLKKWHTSRSQCELCFWTSSCCEIFNFHHCLLCFHCLLFSHLSLAATGLGGSPPMLSPQFPWANSVHVSGGPGPDCSHFICKLKYNLGILSSVLGKLRLAFFSFSILLP